MPRSKTKIAHEGLTYDDVLMLPSYSEVLPRQVDITTRLTKNIVLKVPLISAAMDTVTEHVLAIAMARLGGIGIIHKNMTIEKQAEEVRKVKRADSGLIDDPLTLHKDAKIGQALNLMKENRIGGIPIVDDGNKLVGILTNRDLRFQQDMDLLVSEVMTTENLITAPKETNMKKAESILKNHKVEKLPVVDKEGILVGLITYKDIMKLKNFPNACKDTKGRLRVGAAVGITSDTVDRVRALLAVGCDVIVVDTAHGHSKGVIDMVKKLKKQFATIELIAGNVATGAGAKALMDAGVDAVKVGVGPGSICTTRIVTGVGVPQLTAVMEAFNAVKGKIPIIADGGIRYTGDIVKAIAGGADCIMAGSLFAGTEESPGETIIYEGRKFKSYRGMGSVEAMKEGSADRYAQDVEADIKKLVPEGIVGRVPYKGTLVEIMNQYIGGLRAGMGYTGSKDIAALQKAQFTRITAAGVKESHPHDVVITKDAPNYSK